MSESRMYVRAYVRFFCKKKNILHFLVQIFAYVAKKLYFCEQIAKEGNYENEC